MATSTTKKSSTKSKSTATKTEPKKKAATKSPSVDNKKASAEVVKETTTKVVERISYQTTDLIPCKSVRYGTLQHVSKKSGNLYEW